MKAALLVLLYAPVTLLVGFEMAKQTVDVREKVQEEMLLRGTWEQYGTQLLASQGYWAYAASWAIHNTKPSLEAMKAVLED